MTPRRTESVFQSALMRALNAPVRATRVWRQPAGKVQSTESGAWVQCAPTGAADLSGDVAPHGLRLEVECKAARGRQTPDQLRWQARCERAGVVYVVVHDMEGAPLDVSVAAAVARVDAAIAKRTSAYMSRTCHIPMSPEQVRSCHKGHTLMCGKRWELVPENVRRAVYASYERCLMDGRPAPWLHAAYTAMACVLEQSRDPKDLPIAASYRGLASKWGDRAAAERAGGVQ